MIPCDINQPVFQMVMGISHQIGAPIKKISLFFKNKKITNTLLPLKDYGIGWNTPEG